MPKNRTSVSLVVAAILALALGGWLMAGMPWLSGAEEAETRIIDPRDRDLVALGETVYAANCAACHGAALEGQANWQTRNPDGKLPAPPHDASGHTWHHPDPQLFALTKLGPAALVGGGYASDMPGYDGVLSDREIRASIAYIKSRWPEEIRAQQAEITRRALAAESGD